jgi:protein ERP2
MLCVYSTEASEEGDYRFCFDNTFSHFNSKTVFFEIIVESDDDDDDDDDNEKDPPDIDFENYGGLSPEELYDIKIQDIQVRFFVLITLVKNQVRNFRCINC